VSGGADRLDGGSGNDRIEGGTGDGCCEKQSDGVNFTSPSGVHMHLRRYSSG
jgi:Ca2+-binding RTX toxin-like protein